MSTNDPIEVAINGEILAIPSGQTILRLLQSLDLDPARGAVELDRLIVKPHDWHATPVVGGARLEIVQFVGGG